MSYHTADSLDQVAEVEEAYMGAYAAWLEDCIADLKKVEAAT